jgi:two-component system OmpR family response regulator
MSVRVLVVEDEPRMARLLTQALSEDGRSATLAVDGLMALEHCERDEFDVILLDVMLPKLDGYAVCRELRRRGSRATIMMTTAKHELSSRIRGFDAGADDYLVKPYSLRELLARVGAVERRLERSLSATLRVGNLLLDPQRRSMSSGTTTVQLSVTEFDLLVFFVKHLDLTLSRGRILEGVWEFPQTGSSNVIDQYVAYLRRKLEHVGGGLILQTVRGVGYRATLTPASSFVAPLGERVGQDAD